MYGGKQTCGCEQELGAPGAGNYPTAVKGFVLHCNTSSADPWPNFYQPVIIVVAQGRKLVRIGGDEYHYGENVCFVAGVDMPVTSCVMEASEEKPYLSMSLNLDAARIANLAARVPPPSPGDAAPRGRRCRLSVPACWMRFCVCSN